MGRLGTGDQKGVGAPLVFLIDVATTDITKAITTVTPAVPPNQAQLIENPAPGV